MARTIYIGTLPIAAKWVYFVHILGSGYPIPRLYMDTAGIVQVSALHKCVGCKMDRSKSWNVFRHLIKLLRKGPIYIRRQ
jgi:hypothetical protein